jgi:outer membrane protein assembly factor BamB
VQAEKGFVALVKASPERLEEVSRLDALHAKTWNPPALAGRWLLLRNDREAVCYELPAK